jgi:hypothetical protein
LYFRKSPFAGEDSSAKESTMAELIASSILFYSTALYAFVQWNKEGSEDGVDVAEEGRADSINETTPLIPS